MVLDEKDKQILLMVERYLYEINDLQKYENGDTFEIKVSEIKDLTALDLYFKLYAINEKLKNDNTNEHKNFLISNMVSYLFEIWNNDSLEDIEKHFINLGFTKEDMLNYGVYDDSYTCDKCNKIVWLDNINWLKSNYGVCEKCYSKLSEEEKNNIKESEEYD